MPKAAATSHKAQLRLRKAHEQGKRTLNVVYLDDDRQDLQRMGQIHDHISAAAKRFFFDKFGSVDIEIVLHTANSVQNLLSVLKEVRGMAAVEDSVMLFILDYYIVLGEGATSVTSDDVPADDGTYALPTVRIAGQRFFSWLNLTFPVTPAVLLSRAGADLNCIELGVDAVWLKDSLRNTTELSRLLYQLLGDRFAPEFWHGLRDYAEQGASDSWHTPGHNRGNAFVLSPFQSDFHRRYGDLIFKTDLSVSVDSLGDLSEPDDDSPLARAEHRAAKIFGAQDTFFITNGSSSSNKALLATVLRPGEVVIVDRNCHKSVHQSIVMAGALPLYLPSRFNTTLGVWAPVDLMSIESCISQDFGALNPRVMILTSCTYEGVHYPIRAIVDLCETRGILLVADEAWAPHARFHPSYLRPSAADEPPSSYSALDAGAHLVVHSSHKTLAAFSQASMLHVSKRLDALFASSDDGGDFAWLRERFSFDGTNGYLRFRHELIEWLRYWHSTSPHYPMLATLELAGIQMALEGRALISERLGWVSEYLTGHRRIGKYIAKIEHVVGRFDDGRYDRYYKDPLKVLVRVAQGDPKKRISAKADLCAALKRAHIQWEKASAGAIEFLVTIGTTKQNIVSLAAVLDANVKLLNDSEDEPDFRHERAWTQLAMVPRTAVHHPSCELVELLSTERTDDTVGRVAAQFLVPYPPGIPLLIPGLTMTSELRDWVVNAILAGGARSVHGLVSHQGRYYIRMLQRGAEGTPGADIDRINRIADAIL